jgi:acyl carrier protein
VESGRAAADAERITLIARLMGELLQAPPLDPEQSFFEAGGHSLLAAELAGRLQKLGYARPPLRLLFESPSPRALAARLDTAAIAEAPLPRRADRSRAPLSAVQAGLWYLECRSEDPRVNLLPSAHRLVGALDRDCFETALRALIARQPALRTVLAVSSEGVEQRVLDNVNLALGFADLSAAADPEAAALEAANALQAEPIDLRQGPPFRAALLRIGENTHVFVFVVHHLVWDGWSFDLLYTELAELYAAALEGRSPHLPALGLDYGDFAAWQQAQLAAGRWEAAIRHWQQRLLPLPAPLQLCAEGRRPEPLSGAGDSLLLRLPPAEVDALHALARRHGTTLFVLLLAAWAEALARIGGREDLILGLPVRGRERPELLPLMGCFVNAVPLRLQTRSGALDDWLGVVHARLAEALGQAELPLDVLVPALRRAGAASERALFDCLFSFQDARDRISHWGPLAHRRFDMPVRNSAYPLGLWCVETEAGLELLFNYSTDLFTRERIAGWAEAYAARLRRWLGDASSLSDPPASSTPAADSIAAQVRLTPAAGGRSASPPSADAASADDAPAESGHLPELLRICRELLQVDRIEPSDNFFELGGHSLLALNLMGRVEALTGHRLSLLRLGDSSLEALAAELDAADARAADAELALAAAPAVDAAAEGGGWLRRLFGRGGA